MSRKRFSPEQITGKLHHWETLPGDARIEENCGFLLCFETYHGFKNLP